MSVHFEPTGNGYWWRGLPKTRSRCLKVLKRFNRVLTPALVNACLPPLPPKLWRKMKRKFPHLYKDEMCTPALGQVPKREWSLFVAACRRWKVTPTEVLLAAMCLFVRMVEDETKEEEK